MAIIQMVGNQNNKKIGQRQMTKFGKIAITPKNDFLTIVYNSQNNIPVLSIDIHRS
jgi:hypothetical protein